MGRNSFLGGSTVVGPKSGWFTGTGSESPKSRKKKAKKRKSKNRVKVHNLLRQIARNHLLDQPAPSIPKNFGPSLKQEIAQGGGLLEWARARPDYELVENVMLNNLLRNEPSKFRDAHRSELSKIRRPIVFDGAEPTDAYRSHIETLRDELIEIEAALSDFKSQLELEHRQLLRLKIQIQIDHHQQMVEAIEKEILRWSQKIGQVAKVYSAG